MLILWCFPVGDSDNLDIVVVILSMVLTKSILWYYLVDEIDNLDIVV